MQSSHPGEAQAAPSAAPSAGATTTVVKPESVTTYRNVGLFAVVLLVLGSILAGVAPICQSRRNGYYYYYGYHSDANGYGSYHIPIWCRTPSSWVWNTGVLTFVAMCLTWASLSQSSTKTPAESNTQHFHCMNVWAIVLASLGLFFSAWACTWASTQHRSDYKYYSCRRSSYSCTNLPYYPYRRCSYSNPTSCQQSRAAFYAKVKKLEDDSLPHHIILGLGVYFWAIFSICTIIVPSRIKYWCCPECKKDSTCTPEPTADPEACGTCVCCLPSPGASVAPAVNMVVIQAPGVPLAVGGGTVVQPQPIVQQQIPMTEVQYWLTNELQLPQYTPQFVAQGYDRMQAIVFGVNSEADLRKIVPSILPGHVHLILANIQMKRQQMQMQVQMPSQPVYAVAGAAQMNPVMMQQGAAPPVYAEGTRTS